ncbi:MAG: thioredoxin [Kiloniellales bacterium]|nr:thioredoxin [Kiloniellales bacterium]
METIIGADNPAAAHGAGAHGDLIKDSSAATFAADVLDASMTVPVIVDFWAPWCGPCKTLGPALEKAVTEARGAVRMVKVNIDENQEIAAQLRVQSIPTVYAFFQGRPVDGFVGAQPESQIKQFVARLAETAGTTAGPSPVDQALEQAQAALEAGQAGAASALYGQVLQQEPDNATAIAGMIRCRLAAGDAAGAKQMFDGLSDEQKALPELASVAASLELAEAASAAGPIPELQAKLGQDENDHQTRFDLALALIAAEQKEAATDALLEIVRRNRAWNEEAARKQLLKLFEAWGPTDPLTVETRRRLSSLLFS